MKVLYVWLPVVAVIALAFSGYLFSGLIGMTFAAVAFPLYRRLHQWLHSPRGLRVPVAQARALAAIATESIVLLSLVVGLVLPALVVYRNRALLVSHVLSLYGQTMDWSQAEVAALENRLVVDDTVLSDSKAALAHLGTPLEGLRSLFNGTDSLLPFLARSATLLAVAGVHLLVMVLIMHVSLLHGPDFWEHLLEHTSDGWLVTLQQLGQRAREVLRATYLVHGLTAVVAFAIALPVFWFILGPPNFFLAAVLCFLFQLIPFLGSSILIVAMGAYYLMERQPMRGWDCLLVALPLVAGVPDLVVRPLLARVMGRMMGVTMLIGLVAGLEAFGPSGFVLGPLALELFVCFSAIMLYGPANAGTYGYPPRTGLERPD